MEIPIDEKMVLLLERGSDLSIAQCVDVHNAALDEGNVAVMTLEERFHLQVRLVTV